MKLRCDLCGAKHKKLHLAHKDDSFYYVCRKCKTRMEHHEELYQHLKATSFVLLAMLVLFVGIGALAFVISKGL